MRFVTRLLALALACQAPACTPSPPSVPPPATGASLIKRLPKGARLAKPEGHLAPITCLAFSPDGRQLVSGSADNTLLVWDTTNGELVQRLEGHQRFASECLFLPDGRVASGGAWGEVFLWDVARGQVVERMNGLGIRHHVSALGVRPDGRELTAGTSAGKVIAWSLETGKVVFENDYGEGQLRPVRAVGYQGEGGRWVAGSNGTRVWAEVKPSALDVDAVSGLALPGGRLAWGAEGHVVITKPDGSNQRLGGHSAWVSGLAANASGELLVAGDNAGRVEVWALAGETLRCHLNTAAGIRAAAFDPRGNRFVIAGNEGVLEVVPLDACEGGRAVKPSKRWGSARGRIRSAAAGESVLLGDSSGQVSAWRTTSWQLEGARKVHAGEVTSLVALPGGRWVSGGIDSKVFLGEPSESRHLKSLRNTVRALASIRGGEAVLAADSGGILTDIPFEAGPTPKLVDTGRPLYAVAVSPDGSYALAGGAHDVIYRVPLSGGPLDKWPDELPGSESTTALTFLSGERWVQGGTRGTVLLHRGPNVEKRLRGLGGQVHSLASVGPHLWAGGINRHLLRWSVEGASDPDREFDEGAEIYGLAATPDARFLVANLSDGSASVRALPEGEPVARLVPLRDGGGVTILADGRVFTQGEAAKSLRFEDPSTRKVFALGESLRPRLGAPVLTRLADGAVQVRTTVFSPDGPPRVKLDGFTTLRSVYPSPSMLAAYDVEFELYSPRGGRHTLAALVPNAPAIELPFTLAPDPKLGPGKPRALLVGNASYATATALPGVTRDVEAMGTFFAGDQGWGLGPDRLKVALNLKAEPLRETVKRFFADAAPGETLLFYYSGHGDKKDDEGYLVPTDAAPGRLDSALSASELWQMIEASRAGRVLVILDACKSGGFAIPDRVDRAALRGKATFLAATEPNAVAMNSPGGSAFTRALLAALRDPNRVDGRVLAVTVQRAFLAAADAADVLEQRARIYGSTAAYDMPIGWPQDERVGKGSAAGKGTGPLLRKVDAVALVPKQLGAEAKSTGLGADRAIGLKVLFGETVRAVQVDLYEPAGTTDTKSRLSRMFEAPAGKPWPEGHEEEFRWRSPQMPRGEVRLEVRACAKRGDCDGPPTKVALTL